MASGWTVLDALNNNSKAAADDAPKARFRTRDISIRKIYPNKRNFYGVQDVEKLAQEILAEGLLENMAVTHAPCDEGEYRIIAGEKRWRALCLLVESGHKEFEMVTCQIRQPASEHEEMVQLIMANSYRDKTVADILEEERQLKEALTYMQQKGLTMGGYKLDSGRLRDVIADMMQASGTKIAQIESINNRLIPEFTKELKEGRLTFSAAYEISGMSADGQQEMLAKYQEDGNLTLKEVKAAKAAAQDAQKPAEASAGQQAENSAQETGKEQERAENEATGESEEGEEYRTPHPEGITSLCYSCKRYSECNVKTGTCTKCDEYVNKAEAEKTEEQRYSEEQDAIDRETQKKLREKAQEEKMQQLPSDNAAREPKVHDIRLGAPFFDDVLECRKNFELRKNDRDYKVGDILYMMEFKDGRNTGRAVKRKIIYMLEDFTGLEDGYCILGTEPLQDAQGNGAGQDAAQDAAQPVLQYGA